MGAQARAEEATLRAGAQCCERSSKPHFSGMAVPRGTCCSQLPEKLLQFAKSRCFRSIVLGQVLSFLIACMSMSAASLQDRGVNLPNLLNFLNYAFICVVFFCPMIVRRRGSLKLQLHPLRYAFYALVSSPSLAQPSVGARAVAVLLSRSSGPVFSALQSTQQARSFLSFRPESSDLVRSPLSWYHSSSRSITVGRSSLSPGVRHRTLACCWISPCLYVADGDRSASVSPRVLGAGEDTKNFGSKSRRFCCAQYRISAA